MAGDLDLKEISHEALSAMIQKHQLAQRHIVYQKPEYCAELRRRDMTIRVTPPLKRVEELDSIAAMHPFGVDVDWSILSGELIADCHRRGLVVFSDASGPNETIEQYQQAMSWGIDCIRTDHPVRVLRAIELTSMRKLNR